MDIAAYARYLFLLQYHLRDEHDGKQCLVDGKSQFILDEQLNYPICMACRRVISPRSINMELTEEVMERYAGWSCRRRWSAGDGDYSVAQLAKFPQEIVWTHDYNEAGELVCIDPHYADTRARQLHSLYETTSPSAAYTPPDPSLVTGMFYEDGILTFHTAEGIVSMELPQAKGDSNGEEAS